MYIVGGSIAGLMVAYFVYDIIKTRRQKRLGGGDLPDTSPEEVINYNPNTNNTNNDVNAELGITKQDGSYVRSYGVKLGDRGKKVYMLQSALNSIGANLELDGKLGQGTYTAFVQKGGVWLTWGVCSQVYTCNITDNEIQKVFNKATKYGWNEQKAESDALQYWNNFGGGAKMMSVSMM